MTTVVELQDQLIDRTPCSQFEEVVPKFQVAAAFDRDVGVLFWIRFAVSGSAAAPVAD